MKITDDILRAIQGCIEGLGSKTQFAAKANVNVETIASYLSKQTRTIADDVWERIYPLIRPYLPVDAKRAQGGHGRPPQLTSNQKILLDAFVELPEQIQNQKVLEIVELARQELLKKKN